MTTRPVCACTVPQPTGRERAPSPRKRTRKRRKPGEHEAKAISIETFERDQCTERAHEVVCLDCGTVFARIYELVPPTLLIGPARVGESPEVP